MPKTIPSINPPRLPRPPKPGAPPKAVNLIPPEITTNPATRIGLCLSMLSGTMQMFHVRGDQLAAEAAVARDRRTQRNRNAANVKARAVGTALEASGWLYATMAKGMQARDVGPERGRPALERAIVDGILLAEDLGYDACIAAAYKPEKR